MLYMNCDCVTLARHLPRYIYILHYASSEKYENDTEVVPVVQKMPITQRVSILGQIILLQRKKAICIANNLHISTNPTPLCSPSFLASNEFNSISLAPLLAELAYLIMLFILQLMHTAGSVRQLKNK